MTGEELWLGVERGYAKKTFNIMLYSDLHADRNSGEMVLW